MMKPLNQKGQALVELAILLPLLLLIVFGITEFGRAFYIKNSLTNAAREGARRASISKEDPTADPTRADLRRYVGESCPFPIDTGAITIESTSTPPEHGASTITVTVPYEFTSTYDLFDPDLHITLKGRASMFYE